MRRGYFSPEAKAQLLALLEHERHHYDWEFLQLQGRRVIDELRQLTKFIDLGVRFKIDKDSGLYWRRIKRTPFVLAYRITDTEVRVVLVKHHSSV